MLSKAASGFLVFAGAFNIVIWPRFAKAIVNDHRAWAATPWASQPTAFLWVHAVLIGSAIAIGIGVLWIGIRALRQAKRSDRIVQG